MAKKLGLPMERAAVTLDEQGNTSAASIPLALDKVIREGKVKRDHLLLLESFGGGLAWGSALVRY
jgi:3-oxoacyl-[acyl-carrier-protein] synthase-3